MIACPVCASLVSSSSPTWGQASCSCGRLYLTLAQGRWRFLTNAVGTAPATDFIELTVDERLVHEDKNGVRTSVPRDARLAFVRGFVDQALAAEVLES